MRQPAEAFAGTPAPPGSMDAARAAAVPRDSAVLRLVAFGALAAFATAHWGQLVLDAPTGRMALVVLVAIGAGGVLILLGRAPLPRWLVWVLAALVGVAALALGLMAAGLPGRMLLPGGWDELVDGLDRGLAGVQGVEWPYDGPDEWIRLTILLGAPLFLAIGATLAFWPARRFAPLLRLAGLVALLFLYGAAVTEQDPGEPLLRGLVLLLLVAAYLWLPRLPAREAVIAAAAVVAVGVLSLPVASAMDRQGAWWDYQAWSLFGEGKRVTFDWTHQYGPLDWPRDGTTLLNVKSDRPHYWKAQTLDGFDGFRWFRSSHNDTAALGAELPFDGERGIGEGEAWDYFEYNPRWDEEIEFTVRSLSTQLVVGAGLTHDVDGVNATTSADGTARLIGEEPLEKGDSYSIRTYAPDPSARQMTEAPEGYPDSYVNYTALYLPNSGESATEDSGPVSDQARELQAQNRELVFVPLRGEPDSGHGAEADAVLRSSEYARMYELTQELTADATTSYEVVKAIERHLQENYRYSERVPTRPLPLNGFLFEERRGYCQHFSGAMALMLRMAGIPARVAAGFSPGSFNTDTGEYRVRDLDAHSWVEVWFTGIGWVPFDPTPAASPAESQSSAAGTSAAAADAGEIDALRRQGVAAERADANPTLSSGDGGPDWVVPVLLLLLLGGLAGAGFWVTRRVQRLHALGPSERSEAQLAELRRALRRLGWDVPARTTLLALERRLGRSAGPASEAYAGALRAARFDPRAPAGPDLTARRAVRRELSRGSAGDRLRGLFAMPPGGPRPQ